MKKLFVVVVGGDVTGCHVELHDTRFAIGERIEDCYDDLKAQWWGNPQSLHLDAWGPLEWADGYRIDIVDTAPAEDVLQRLWFLNLGGYDPLQFTELHHNVFFIAPDWRSAKTRAIAEIKHWTAPHKDFAFDVEKAVDVGAAAGAGKAGALKAGGGHIRLTRDDVRAPFRFEARYVPIGKIK